MSAEPTLTAEDVSALLRAARAEERAACARAVCWHCRCGSALHRDGALYYHLWRDGSYTGERASCDALAIWQMGEGEPR